MGPRASIPLCQQHSTAAVTLLSEIQLKFHKSRWPLCTGRSNYSKEGVIISSQDLLSFHKFYLEKYNAGWFGGNHICTWCFLIYSCWKNIGMNTLQLFMSCHSMTFQSEKRSIVKRNKTQVWQFERYTRCSQQYNRFSFSPPGDAGNADRQLVISETEVTKTADIPLTRVIKLSTVTSGLGDQ